MNITRIVSESVSALKSAASRCVALTLDHFGPVAYSEPSTDRARQSEGNMRTILEEDKTTNAKLGVVVGKVHGRVLVSLDRPASKRSYIPLLLRDSSP